MKFKGYVYRIYCNQTSKNYIGITTRDVNVRWKQHENEALNDNRKSNHFHNAIVKYGWDEFDKTVLLTLESDSKEVLIESLRDLEKFYVEKYDSYRNGYNSTIGGEGVIGDVNCKKVLVFNELGEFIEELDSRVEAGNKYNVIPSSISDCCNRVIYTAGWLNGLRLVFRNEGDTVTDSDISKIKTIRKNQIVSVKSYDYYTGELLKTYKSIVEASEDTGIDSNSISKCAKRKLISTGVKGQSKLVWRYLNDNYEPKYTIEGFINGKSIGKFVDMQIVKKLYGINPSSISNCLSGKSNSAGKIEGKWVTWKRI